MSIVTVGFDFEEWGTIESTDSGLVVSGDENTLTRLIRDMQHDMPDKEFIQTLPDRLNNRMWAKPISTVTEKAHIDEAAMRSVETANNDLFFMLKFRNLPTLRRWQAHAQEALSDQNIEWSDSGNFHTTLVFVSGVSRMDTFELTMGVDVIDAVPVVIEGFGTFSTERGDSSNTLYLAIEKTEELAGVQERLFDFVKSLGFEMSPFSIPEDWTPHITLGTSEEPFDEMLFPDIGGMAISASDVEASVDFEALAISEKFNPAHEPKGSPKGGQFTSGPRSGGRSKPSPKKVRKASTPTRDVASSRLFSVAGTGAKIGELRVGTSSLRVDIKSPATRSALNNAGISNDALAESMASALAEVNPEHLEGINSFSFGLLNNMAGQYNFGNQNITIDPTQSTLAGGQHDMEYLIKHEIGHNAWLQLTPAQRERYAELVGHPNPESARDIEGITKDGTIAKTFYEATEGKEIIADVFGTEVTKNAVSEYGMQNLAESWAESYSTIDWVTGEIDSEGVASGTVSMLREISEW